MSNTHTAEVLKLLHELKYTHNLDFYNYAATSFERRVYSIINRDQLTGVSDIITNLTTKTGYLTYFLSSITVNVTTLFRDPSCWLTLKKEIVESKLASKENISIWIAGCSTGEEAYSINILLKEIGLWNKTRITATDLSPKALVKAKQATINKLRLDEFKQNYQLAGGEFQLIDYFLEQNNELHFDQNLLKNTTFLQHNLISLIAIDDVDLVICRNVLIYFNQELQNNIVKTFHRVSNKQSFLFLGQNESLDCLPNTRLYHLENTLEKIYISLKS